MYSRKAKQSKCRLIPNHKILDLFLAVLFLVIFFDIQEVSANSCVSQATGNWATAGTWTSCGGVVPTNADNVTIASGHTVTMNGNAGAALSLTINGTATWSSTRTTNVGTGGVTIASTGNIAGTSVGVLTTTGNLTVNATTTGTGPTITMQTTAGLTISGTGSIAKITISTTTTNNGNLTVRTTLAGASTLTNGAGATLNVTPATVTPTLTATAAGNTVNYVASGAQTVKATAYANLGLSGSGAKTMTSVTTISGNFELSGTATATTAANLTVGGNLTIGTGTSLTVPAYTIGVTGSTSITGTLVLSSTTGTKTFSGDVTINSGGVWNESAAAVVSYGGSLTNNATTWTGSSGVHTFSGTGKTISGSTTTIISSVTVTGSVTNSGTLTTTGTLTGGGSFTNGDGSTGTLNYAGGTIPVTTFAASAAGNTVNYNASGGQTVKAVTYNNLKLSGSGAKVLTSVTTINGDFELSGTASATTTSDLTVGGSLTIGTGTSLTFNGQTIGITGATSITGSIIFGSATNTKTFTGDVTLNSGSSWTENAAVAINFGGSLTNNATLWTTSTGTHTFTGTSKTISGATTTEFPTVSVSGSVTNNVTVTISTALSGAGTFTQGASGSLNLGGSVGSSTLVASASGNTVTYNSSLYTQTVAGTTYHHLIIDNSLQSADLGASTTVNGDLTITSNGTLTTSGSSYPLILKGDYTNSGTFTANSGTVTLSGTAKQTLSGTMTGISAFNGLTITNSTGTEDPACGSSFTPGIDFAAAVTATTYTITTGGVKVEYESGATYTFTNINWDDSGGSDIFFRNSVLGSGTWLLNVSGTQTSVSDVNVARSDATPGNTIDAYDGTNTNCNNNTDWTWTSGSLSLDIVNSGGTPVGSPSVSMLEKYFSFVYQTTTGTLGVTDEKIRVTNTTASAQWSLSIAATGGSTAYWDGTSSDYDYNDPTASAGDGSDSDLLGGQLTVNPAGATITPQGGCSATDISQGDSESFNEETANNDIDLATAGASAETSCYWDITGISLSQTIPAEQLASTYTLNMTITLAAT